MQPVVNMEALMRSASLLESGTGLRFGIQYFLLGKETFPRYLPQPAVGSQRSHPCPLVQGTSLCSWRSGAEAFE